MQQIARNGSNGATTTGSGRLRRLIATTLQVVPLYTGGSVASVETSGHDAESHVARQVDGTGEVSPGRYDRLGRRPV